MRNSSMSSAMWEVASGGLSAVYAEGGATAAADRPCSVELPYAGPPAKIHRGTRRTTVRLPFPTPFYCKRWFLSSAICRHAKTVKLFLLYSLFISRVKSLESVVKAVVNYPSAAHNIRL